MQEHTYSDINEAKRRVQEMKNRAREQSKEEPTDDMLALFSNQKSDRDRAFLLTLLYLLSQKEISDELILSILYILFN